MASGRWDQDLRRGSAAPPRPVGGRGGAGRWARLAGVVLLAAGGLVGCGGHKDATPSPHPVSVDHPNIVFVLTDDLSNNLVTKRFMPNLWALKATGATFSHYFVTDSLCCPSRSSIFTGRYPHDTGVFTNTGKDGGYETFESHDDERSTVATDLQADGYRTAMMGKYLNGYNPLTNPPAKGWNEWDVAGGGGYAEFNYPLNEDGKVVDYGGPRQPGHDNYLVDVLSGLGQTFIRSSTTPGSAHPFFLEIATFAPHSPYVPAPKYAHLYPRLQYPRGPAWDVAVKNPPAWLRDRPPLTHKQIVDQTTSFRRRAEDVKSVDDMIGALVATLKKQGVWDNTYLVFSSDNGYHMGEHRLLAGKLTAFDTDINVPLIVVGPHVPVHRTVLPFAENIDLRSTFDAWAGTAPGEGVDGRSVVPLLLPSTVPADWPDGVLVEHHGPVTNHSDPDYPPLGSGNPPSYEALRINGALYVEYADGEREYYNLYRDPYENDNVYAALSRPMRRALHRELLGLEHCHDSPVCSDVTTPLA